ncbi:MAG: hypothetical protein ABI663_24525 [Chryseolinea sp.]
MDLLKTLKPNNKTGISMRTDLYEALKNKMIDLLKEDGWHLHLFFRVLHEQFSNELGEETGWYLYHVKLDLETKGVIKVERSKGRRDVITKLKLARNWQSLMHVHSQTMLL